MSASPTPELTPEECVALDRHVARLERSTGWPAAAVSLVLAVVLAVVAVHQIASAYTMLTASPPALEHLDVRSPGGSGADQWMLRQIRKTADVVQGHSGQQVVGVVHGVVGLAALVLAILALSQVRAARRRAAGIAVIAKIARWQLQQWQPAPQAPAQASAPAPTKPPAAPQA